MSYYQNSNAPQYQRNQPYYPQPVANQKIPYQQSNVRIRPLNGQQQQYYEAQDDNKQVKQYVPSFNQQSSHGLMQNQSSQNRTPQYQQQHPSQVMTSMANKYPSSYQNNQQNELQKVQSNYSQQYGNRVTSGIDQQRNQHSQYLPSSIQSNNSTSMSQSNPSYGYAKNNNYVNQPSSGYQSNQTSTASSSNKTSLSASNSSQNGQYEVRNNISNRNYLSDQQATSNPIGSHTNLSSNQYNQSSSSTSSQSQASSQLQSKANYQITAVTAKKVNNRKCGLMNIGNTCYMNSALQCLFNIPGFLEFFISGKYKGQINSSVNKGVADEFALIAKQVEQSSGKNSYERPSGLKRAIERVNQQFYGSGQQDAQELLRTLLDGLHNDLNRVQGKKPYRELDANTRQKAIDQIGREWFEYYLDRDNSIITDFFTGQLMSKVTCQLCHSDSIAFDNFMDLSLSFTNSFRIINQQDLDRLMQAFLKEEALDDTYYCKNCKKHTKSKRQFYIWKLPDILVIHLKRFIFGSQRREKLNQDITFPIKDFNMGRYLERQKDEEHLYDLIGVLNHSGSLYGGHYTAQCKNPYDGSWNEFNDSSWNEININSQSYDKTGSNSPYLLFYCKKGFQQKMSLAK